MKIDRIANSAKYRMDEQFQDLLIFGILIVFIIKKKFKLQKYLKFKIRKTLNVGN